MIFVGIDPGLTGGIAIINEQQIKVYPYTPEKLINICKNFVNSNSSVLVAVEKVHAMPKQGVSSTFNFGMGFENGLSEMSFLFLRTRYSAILETLHRCYT